MILELNLIDCAHCSIRQSDEIGKHTRLKIERRKRLVGSSPTSGTVMIKKNTNSAYVVGVALGDGNLSNPNGRATRLRITCDKKYPLLIERIVSSLYKILPDNKVSLIDREGCFDVSCYSNQFEDFLGWKVSGGSKEKQNVRVPRWILEKDVYIKRCLKGLFETDGSIYKDRTYIYANFTTILFDLSEDVMEMTAKLGVQAKRQKSIQCNGKTKYVVRVSKNAKDFIKLIDLNKR